MNPRHKVLPAPQAHHPRLPLPHPLRDAPCARQHPCRRHPPARLHAQAARLSPLGCTPRAVPPLTAACACPWQLRHVRPPQRQQTNSWADGPAAAAARLREQQPMVRPRLLQHAVKDVAYAAASASGRGVGRSEGR